MNTRPHFQHRRNAPRPAVVQRGVVLLFTLIALTIMMVGAVGLISSIKSSILSAGNIGFKRDLVNQAEVAAGLVMRQFNNAALSVGTTPGRGANNPALNYSATTLPTTSQGIPNALLLDDTNFALIWTLPDPVGVGGVKLRYVIDRLCTTAGDSQELDTNICLRAPQLGGTAPNKAIDESRLKRQAEAGVVGTAGSPGVRKAVPEPAVYRLTVRGTSARDTQAFYQVVFTEPVPPPAPLPP